MFIWEPHGCRPSLHRDESQLPQSEQLNDDGTWMVDSLGTGAGTFFHATLSSQDNIKGHVRRYGKQRRLSAYISL